ncbi:copper resistance protein CopC [Streptomyces stramineus]
MKTLTAGRLLPLLGTLLAALLCAIGPGAGTASAHAALTSTDPADGSVVPAAPQRVVLTFSEGVLLTADSLRVLDPRGSASTRASPRTWTASPVPRPSGCAAASPTAPTRWPGRRCRRTATRWPGPSPSP